MILHWTLGVTEDRGGGLWRTSIMEADTEVAATYGSEDETVARAQMIVGLRSALLAEREACAQVAESFIPSGFRGGNHPFLGDAFGIARDDRARTIAHAIRQRADA